LPNGHEIDADRRKREEQHQTRPPGATAGITTQQPNADQRLDLDANELGSRGQQRERLADTAGDMPCTFKATAASKTAPQMRMTAITNRGAASYD